MIRTLSLRSLLATGVILLMACGSEPESEVARQPVNPLLTPKRLADKAPENFRVRLETSEGDVVIEVFRGWAPKGADRFYNLVENAFYDDIRVYRVLDGFMAQFGMNGDPRINITWRDAVIVDDPVLVSNTRGRVSFAKGGPNSRTTELFINYRDNSSLDDQGFAPLGEVVEGMDVVDAFYSGYGDGPPRGDGPYQAQVQGQGNAYLDVSFPELTRIISAKVEVSGS